VPFDPREDIAQVYVRQARHRLKGVTRLSGAVGVPRIDGACLYLIVELIPDEIVRRQATAIAAALQWKEPVVEFEGEVQSLDHSMKYANFCWAGLLMLPLVWIGVAGLID